MQKNAKRTSRKKFAISVEVVFDDLRLRAAATYSQVLSLQTFKVSDDSVERKLLSQHVLLV